MLNTDTYDKMNKLENRKDIAQDMVLYHAVRQGGNPADPGASVPPTGAGVWPGGEHTAPRGSLPGRRPLAVTPAPLVVLCEGSTIIVQAALDRVWEGTRATISEARGSGRGPQGSPSPTGHEGCS